MDIFSIAEWGTGRRTNEDRGRADEKENEGFVLCLGVWMFVFGCVKFCGTGKKMGRKRQSFSLRWFVFWFPLLRGACQMGQMEKQQLDLKRVFCISIVEYIADQFVRRRRAEEQTAPPLHHLQHRRRPAVATSSTP